MGTRWEKKKKQKQKQREAAAAGRAEDKSNSKHRRGENEKGTETKAKVDVPPPTSQVPSFGKTTGMLLKFGDEDTHWYGLGGDIDERDATILSHPPPSDTTNPKPSGGSPNNKELVNAYRKKADELYHQELSWFEEKTTAASADKKKDLAWMQSTMSKGTLKDRIAAMSVMVSSYPVHRFSAMNGLLQMASVEHTPNRRVAQMAAEAIYDLFVNTLLPRERKLVTLEQRPLYLFQKSPGATKHRDDDTSVQLHLSPRLLLLWRFEEMVRDKYYFFISQYISATLREAGGTYGDSKNGSASEQYQPKIAALQTAATLLRELPEGEATLLQLVVNKLGDPNIRVSSSATYQLQLILGEHPAMQTIVAREVQQLAHRPHLSEKALYNCVTFLNQLRFRRLNDVDLKDTSNSALASEAQLPASLISTYFRLFEVTLKQADETNRGKKKRKYSNYETMMRGRLLSALLTGVNRAHPFLPARDSQMEEHIDALYRVADKAPAGASTQALMLLFQLSVGSNEDNQRKQPQQEKQAAAESAVRKERFYRALYVRLGRPGTVVSGKHLTMFFNLVYKALKYDTNEERVVAMAKRLLATVLHGGPAPAAATLFLLSEVQKYHPTLRTCFESVLGEPHSLYTLDETAQDARKALIRADKSKPEESTTGPKQAPLWELSTLLMHFHPSVVHFANNMGKIEYNGDPLRDFTVMPFLDKFAYKNAKSSEKVAEKLKQMQGATGIAAARNKARVESRMTSVPMNDPRFLEKSDVAVEDKFFQLFFKERERRDELKGRKRKQPTVQAQSENEDDFFDGVESKTFDPSASFDSIAEGWESDEDEEAFVDELAQKIIEDSIDANELGPDELDDEDPDTEGWGDLNADGEDEDNSDVDENDGHFQSDQADISDDGSADFFDTEGSDPDFDMPDTEAKSRDKGRNEGSSDDADAFMDEDDESDGDIPEYDGSEVSSEQILGKRTRSERKEEVEGLEEEEQSINSEGRDEQDKELARLALEEDDDDDEVPSGSKKGRSASVFASLTDFEEEINKGWEQLTGTEEVKESVEHGKKQGKTKKKRRR